jgi:Cellulase (glycosyl hydrolase family 5)
MGTVVALVIFVASAGATGVRGAGNRSAAAGDRFVRMPVGFFDDPSFRWAGNPGANLARAAAAHASIIHTLANWAAIAPRRPRHPLNGNDPAYRLADLDALVRTAGRYDLRVMITITGTPRWANGNQSPNHAPLKMKWLTEFAQMLAHRYSGAHDRGAVTLFSVWNEPNLGLFLVPQFRNGRIVSPALYARLFRAAYRGIKRGDPNAIVAAGETSNRGINRPSGNPGRDSVAPATFARRLAEVAPRLPFAAWADHPYSPNVGLGPGQKVRFPNVSFSTLNRFGAALQRWFHRRVPIWITEYGEETFPEFHNGVTLARQAADAREALRLAQSNRYVRMFIWFVFRDSNSTTWFSGLERASGRKKPAYSAFASAAAGVVGQTELIKPFRHFTVSMPVPWIAYHVPPGSRLIVTYTIRRNGRVVARGRQRAKLLPDENVMFTVDFGAGRRRRYTLAATVRDHRRQFETHLVDLVS